VIWAPERAGCSIDHVTGSHYILYHPGKPQLRVTVVYHNTDMRPSAPRSIIRQAGLTIDEFIDLL
jgi:predicted RNA binding protein YcfA (HicA-like mRNA interferase family)